MQAFFLQAYYEQVYYGKECLVPRAEQLFIEHEETCLLWYAIYYSVLGKDYMKNALWFLQLAENKIPWDAPFPSYVDRNISRLKHAKGERYQLTVWCSLDLSKDIPFIDIHSRNVIEYTYDMDPKRMRIMPIYEDWKDDWITRNTLFVRDVYIRALGVGSYGEVMQVSRLGLPFARKQFLVCDNDEEDFIEELSILMEIEKDGGHVNICKMFDHDYDSMSIYLEVCKMTSLDYMIKSKAKDYISNCRLLLECMTKALIYLHEEVGLLHLDVKPSNILYHRDGIFKLADFSLACKIPVDGKVSFTPFTARYRPFEIENVEKGSINVTKGADIWSLGIVMLEIANHKYNREYTMDLKEIDALLKKPYSIMLQLETMLLKDHYLRSFPSQKKW